MRPMPTSMALQLSDDHFLEKDPYLILKHHAESFPNTRPNQLASGKCSRAPSVAKPGGLSHPTAQLARRSYCAVFDGFHL